MTKVDSEMKCRVCMSFCVDNSRIHSPHFVLTRDAFTIKPCNTQYCLACLANKSRSQESKYNHIHCIEKMYKQ